MKRNLPVYRDIRGFEFTVSLLLNSKWKLLYYYVFRGYSGATIGNRSSITTLNPKSLGVWQSWKSDVVLWILGARDGFKNPKPSTYRLLVEKRENIRV